VHNQYPSNFVFSFHNKQNLFNPKLYGEFLCIEFKQKIVGLMDTTVKIVIVQYNYSNYCY